MRLGEVCQIRTPETEVRFGGRVVYATVVRVQPNYVAFDVHGGLTIMARFDRISRYAPECLLCNTEETDDPIEDDRLWSFRVSGLEAKLSPAHQTLHDAAGEDFGRICTDCIRALKDACEAANADIDIRNIARAKKGLAPLPRLTPPRFWLAPREHVRTR